MPIWRRRVSLVGLAMVASVVLGGPAAEGASPLTVVSGSSPFADCAIQPLPGETNYLNAEVEPWVAANPRNPSNVIGVWQQDRWRFGGSRGLLTGVSHDGGRTWARTAVPFSRCGGGNKYNNGDYERASDPWVTISPNGVAYQIALSFNFFDANQAVLVSRSADQGRTWSKPTPLVADTDPKLVDDKESITADPIDSRFVYAVWDRLEFTDETQNVLVRGPALFARTTDGGKSWEPARVIFDPVPDAQTISNQIVVLPNGDLVNLFVRLDEANENSPKIEDVHLAVIRSRDRGVTWSAPIVIDTLQSIGITDPKTGEPVRTGDIIPNIAVDRQSGVLFVVWQDSRFSGRKRDGIAFSKSRDGGLTWSAPRQINKATNVQALTASIATIGGEIGVTHYDFRRDTPDPKVLMTDYWRLVSDDEGDTWREVHIAGSFDMRTAPFARGFFVGDYEGLTPLGDDVLMPFFVMANSANLANRTDVFATRSVIDDSAQGLSQEETTVPPRGIRELVNSHRERRAGRD